MWTDYEKETFWTGVLVGIITSILLTILTVLLGGLHDPLSTKHPNTVLNDPEYMIDTIVTTSHQNTVVEYKFVKVDE